MITYKIFSEKPESHFVTIEMRFSAPKNCQIQLPAWRPGRYELQNFAKNIARFQVFATDGSELSATKITKDRWAIEAECGQNLIVSYDFYAAKRDAGNSYVESDFMYMNPVNAFMYVEGLQNEPFTLLLPNNFGQKVVCGLTRLADFEYAGRSFYELADSPFFVTDKIQRLTYYCSETEFNIWLKGNYKFDNAQILLDFQRFTEKQIAVFGKFPEPVFHFMLWVLPEAFYHGVEHRNSTMMVLGPDSQPFDELRIDLLGLASHELFHAWNICKIRPAELLPYDYTQENYFQTCYVSEGVTTYFGDLILYEAGVFSPEQYHYELEVRYKQHFINSANAWQSLEESSYDLWLDGYGAAVPNRRVSVYHKGAIAAQILDLHLKRKGKNLGQIMHEMYLRFGDLQQGFTAEDFRNICEQVAEENLGWYFDEVISGRGDLLHLLNHYLADIQLFIQITDGKLTLHTFQA